MPEVVLVSRGASARKGQRGPVEGRDQILFLLQPLTKPQDPSPHSNAPPRKEGGYLPLWKRKGELRNQRRGAGGLWRAKGVPQTSGHAHLYTLGDEEDALKSCTETVRPWRSQAGKPQSKGAPHASSLHQTLRERWVQRQHTCESDSAL